MPEGDVRIFGADTHIPQKHFPLVLGGAAVVAFLAFRSRPSPSGGSGSNTPAAANDSSSLEFARIQQQAATELAQLMAMNKLESQATEYAYKNSPAGQRMCLPLTQYYALDAGTRRSFESRVANGQLLETIGADGICFTPTAQGQAGFMPYVTSKSSSGLFGGSASVTGPAGTVGGTAPMAPSPSLFSIIDSILRTLNQPVF